MPRAQPRMLIARTRFNDGGVHSQRGDLRDREEMQQRRRDESVVHRTTMCFEVLRASRMQCMIQPARLPVPLTTGTAGDGRHVFMKRSCSCLTRRVPMVAGSAPSGKTG